LYIYEHDILFGGVYIALQHIAKVLQQGTDSVKPQ